MKNFKEKVLGIVKSIKKGRVKTYKEVARLAGNSQAARAVGNILAKNFDPKIPCHRVIKSDGSLGNYNRGGTSKKRRLLREEGTLN